MKRWIIRSFFIGLLLLCVGGWVASAKYACVISYAHKGHESACGTSYGVISVLLNERAETDGWDHIVTPVEQPWHFWPPPRPGHLRFFGFGCVRYVTGGILVYVPYWFLTVVSSVALFYFWRKTRPKLKGRAFPVEMAKQVEEQGGKAAKDSRVFG